MAVILEPGFETVTNWVYEENDPYGNLTGSQSNSGEGRVEGTYTYKLNLPVSKTFEAGEWMGIKQSVTIPPNFVFKIHFHNNGFGGGISFKIYVDSTEIYNCDLGQGIPASPGIYTPLLDLSSYSGVHDLKFRVVAVSTNADGNSAQLYLDNIIEGYQDIYINSSSGSDSNMGDSCTSGHPKLTFAAAYALLNSGGTIHICNSGGDFSAETVTLNKSFNIDLNGSSGNFYMPKAS